MTEISDWFAETYLHFAQQENTNSRCSAREFLQRSVFCDAYEFFFSNIHIELHQWLSRLTVSRTNFQARGVPAWKLQRSRMTVL